MPLVVVLRITCNVMQMHTMVQTSSPTYSLPNLLPTSQDLGISGSRDLPDLITSDGSTSMLCSSVLVCYVLVVCQCMYMYMLLVVLVVVYVSLYSVSQDVSDGVTHALCLTSWWYVSYQLLVQSSSCSSVVMSLSLCTLYATRIDAVVDDVVHLLSCCTVQQSRELSSPQQYVEQYGVLLCLGVSLADVVMLVGTIDIVFGSVDLYSQWVSAQHQYCGLHYYDAALRVVLSVYSLLSPQYMYSLLVLLDDVPYQLTQMMSSMRSCAPMGYSITYSTGSTTLRTMLSLCTTTSKLYVYITLHVLYATTCSYALHYYITWDTT